MANETKAEVCEQLAAACRQMAICCEQMALGFDGLKEKKNDEPEAWQAALEAMREVSENMRAHEYALSHVVGVPAEGDEHSALIMSVGKALTG